VKNKSSASQLMVTLKHWTNSRYDKQVIFTVGGMGCKENVNVIKVTKSIVDRELSQVVKNIIKRRAAAGDTCLYQGNVGICNKTLIVNLPGKIQAAENFLAELEVFLESIICALEK